MPRQKQGKIAVQGRGGPFKGANPGRSARSRYAPRERNELQSIFWN